MPDPTPLAVAKKFAALVAAECPSVKEALHYEPEELGSFPAVTMLPKRVQQEDRFTGPATQNTWTWAVSITIDIGGRIVGSDFQEAQERLYTTLPEVLAVARHHPDLDGLLVKACELSDLGEEPELEIDEEATTGIIVKILELTCVTEEV